MASPFELNVDDQVKAVDAWFDFLALANDAASPLHHTAVEALKLLSKRNYDHLPADAAKGTPTEAARGAKLRTDFAAAEKSRRSGDQATSTAQATFDLSADAARSFLRNTHRTVAAIARDEDEPALAGLPLLGEVSVPTRMEKSAERLLEFLRKPEVLKVLAKYGITKAELDEGDATVKKATVAWKSLRQNKDAGPILLTAAISAREASVSWLAKWWNLARGVMASRPDLLKLLGVVDGTLRKPSTSASELQLDAAHVDGKSPEHPEAKPSLHIVAAEPVPEVAEPLVGVS